jgi:hypothetical protein
MTNNFILLLVVTVIGVLYNFRVILYDFDGLMMVV